MTISLITFEDAKSAIGFLEDLAYTNNKEFLFRGHKNSEYKLETTYQRFRTVSPEYSMRDFDDFIKKFRVGLTKNGIKPFETDDRQDWLEFSRHHGLPTPCLDFTYSPYIALFFAFNGIQKVPKGPNKYVTVYVVDIAQLASRWAFHVSDPKKSKFMKIHWEFRIPKPTFFENGYPALKLQFFPFPSKYNIRMQKQQGALLYDTLDYSQIGYKDLEDFIDKFEEPDVYDGVKKKGDPTLFKVNINTNCIQNIMERLELMGITGGSLYMDATGVAMDAINTYHFNPKTSYLRDVDFRTKPPKSKSRFKCH